MSEPDDAEVFAHYPDVHIDRDNIAHYRGLMGGRLLINRCSDCGHWIYPHRPLCPACLSWNVVPTEVSGRGSLYMWTLIYQSRDPDTPLYEPILTAAVELAEQPGLRYLSRVVGCPPEALRHDMPLRLTWIEEAGRNWPAFEPAG
ncbi:putative OB-fold protein [Novosphingobium sp. PhB165]|uniref:Zn-ribbon domain-containing OB-fold protein n=1 Tax=Novosphingobium sp. PhB165 TaxID=2485105 RepID=UPI00104D71F1|nr:OB-fold domain-containing protein [Novosphingobium sp. PhB165]TCM20475.1 putative OB-fold protein [Novosphingobium sp. PhB165]